MLQYLSGIGIGKSAKKVAKREARKEKQKSSVKKEKKAISVTKKQAKGSNLTPVTKSRINKLQVQTKIRKAFVKKAEPIKVTEEEIIEEVEQPTEEIAEEKAEETPTEETQEQAIEESEADLGVYYPNYLGKPKKKIKIKAPKLKGKLKSAVKKAKQRLKDDKHKPAEKVAHQLAKQALLIPRGAFLAIMLLGKALEKTPIKINIGKKVAEVWAKKNKEIKEFWYKVGGEADILEKQIQKFKSSKISGYLGVEPTTTAAAGSITAASPLIAKFLKIVGKGKEFAEKNPKLLAQGQALVKKGIEEVAKKNPQQLKSLNVVADEITKVLPPEQQAKINQIRKTIPKTTIDKVQKNVVSEVKNINEEAGTTPTSETTTTTTKSNTMLYAIGGAVLIGGFLLMKKKK
jgi:hypothetical protein